MIAGRLRLLPHGYFYYDHGARRMRRDQVALDILAVDDALRHTFADALRLAHTDPGGRPAELASGFEPLPLLRQTGIDAQTVVLGADAQDPLAGGDEVPGCRCLLYTSPSPRD